MSRYYYVYLRNNIAIGGIETHGQLPNEVEVDYLPADFLYKKYINGEWLEAEKFNYVTVDENKIVIEKYETYFPEDAPNQFILAPKEVDIGWFWNEENQTWNEVVNN